MSSDVDGLTLQFLEWVAAKPRTYSDVMDAWKSSCPRISIWENALHDGLIRIERDSGSRSSNVTLTPHGRSLLTSS
jgi:hypothetical protein